MPPSLVVLIDDLEGDGLAFGPLGDVLHGWY